MEFSIENRFKFLRVIQPVGSADTYPLKNGEPFGRKVTEWRASFYSVSLV